MYFPLYLNQFLIIQVAITSEPKQKPNHWQNGLQYGSNCIFHVLAIVNDNAMNTRCMHLFELESHLDTCPKVGLLDHMICLFSAFHNGRKTLHSN